jgi:hypothetical protein
VASTLLNEQGFPPYVIELQLAHSERNKVRAAYNKAQRLPERRKMMQAWADYLDGLSRVRRVDRSAPWEYTASTQILHRSCVVRTSEVAYLTGLFNGAKEPRLRRAFTRNSHKSGV